MIDFPPLTQNGVTLTPEDQDFLAYTFASMRSPFTAVTAAGLVRAHLKCTGIAAEGLADKLLHRLVGRGLLSRSATGVYTPAPPTS